jgi:hypothetical protein
MADCNPVGIDLSTPCDVTAKTAAIDFHPKSPCSGIPLWEHPVENRKYKPYFLKKGPVVIADDHANLRHRDVVILFDG